ncbi:MAG: hypothetical protein QNJ97_09950 [Myxococcota bacterium]|nr:hypothetical protein [Myxococcota bacterium]
MRRVALIAFFGVVLYVALVPGCIDRPPAPQCPVPIEVSINEDLVTGFDGVDMLVVVDNSRSMEQEQEILATGFFTLVNSLAKPIIGPDWPFPPVANMRVAIVSSDMGLQYGNEGSIDDVPTDIGNCVERGNDGEFQTDMEGIVNIASGVIACADDGDQCPEDFTCANGVCDSPTPGELYPVNCTELNTGNEFAETSAEDPNGDLATEVACMSKLGKEGCGIEQQLQAAVRALSREGQGSGDGEFLLESHLLAVLIVSDEEDCSIENDGLFSTAEWESGTNPIPGESASGRRNVACNFPEENEEENLFDPSVYWDKFVAIKDDKPRAVIFAAIAGVPTGEDAGCEGRGSALDNCLAHADMQLEVIEYESEGNLVKHFRPACTRSDAEGELLTEARPGRRYVKVAQDFANNGYVYSICNADWSPAMRDIAQVIAENIQPQCYPKRLEWVRETSDDCQTEDCGKAKCDVVAVYDRKPDSNKGCPDELNVSPEDVVTETVSDPGGSGTVIRYYCPLPKLAAPVDCGAAGSLYLNTEKVGWFYCEANEENNSIACSDGWDNDGDGAIDCDDDECTDCEVCPNGTGVDCKSTCPYSVQLTQPAKKEVSGQMVSVQCLQQFVFEDENCQENTKASCTDGEDNDGNGVYDCIEEEDHFADPHCCPLDVVATEDGKNCSPTSDFSRNCPGTSVIDPEWETACVAHARALGCNLVE